MPVTGFPKILEGIINNLLTDARLTSYKIAGCEERTTLVIRFDNNMADPESCLPRHSTPASFRRKSPSELIRDKTRREKHSSSVSIQADREEEIQTPNTSVIKSECTKLSMGKESGVITPAAVHKTSLHSYTSSECSSDDELSEREENRSTINTLKKSTPSPAQQVTADKSRSSAKSNEIVTTGARMLSVTDKNNEHTQIELTDSQYHSSVETTECDGSLQRANTAKQHSSRQHKVKTDTTGSDQPCSVVTHNKREDDDRMKIFDTLLDSDRLQIQRAKLTQDNVNAVTHRNRNNHIKRLVLDFTTQFTVLLVETDDLLLEFSETSKKIIHFFIKTEEQPSAHDKKRLYQMRTWEDQLSHIEQHRPDKVKLIMEALTLLKLYIQ